MTTTGKLTEILAPKSGKSAKGNDWIVQEFVIETEEKYPKKICLQLFGEDKINSLGVFKIGDLITVDFDVESRKYNGRWYTQCNAWRITNKQAQTTAQSSAQEQPNQQDDTFPF